ncbi:LacI family DNA-binding transcriptional regulator [Pelagicoccus mobilis]|uniref:LacI family DNA-binding transcriptional regulator n=1 Tax=Pelagicoccus mobilis TaxID=415221 RepID=A0A934VPS9_9BACT|nr:LacI family DNA-binding transcriptional regulator [Pelagicoccus mobilis]MBK1876125.1 LacI family DNA-binding transcriptional regulator [Pelagicoccus mobilis]
MPRPTSRNKVTQKDVAKAAGVSVMAVSLALRNQPGISEENAKQIRKIADSLGYRPDPALSALIHYRGSKSKKIRAALALVTGWETREKWIDSRVGRLAWEGARKRAGEFGYSLEHFWIGKNGIHAKRTADILRSRGIRGVILAPILLPWAAIDFPWEHFAVVTLERNSDFPSTPHVSPNHYADISRAWHHLLNLGYNRPGLASFSWLSERNENRWEAAQYIQQIRHQAPKERVPNLIVEGSPNARLPVVQTDKWINQYDPDVVLSPSPEFWQAILESGRSIPHDVAFASLQTQVNDEPVAGINQHREEMGAACIDLLHSRLLRSDFGMPDSLAGTTIDGDWIDGPTAPPRKAKKSPK